MPHCRTLRQKVERGTRRELGPGWKVGRREEEGPGDRWDPGSWLPMSWAVRAPASRGRQVGDGSALSQSPGDSLFLNSLPPWHLCSLSSWICASAVFMFLEKAVGSD